MIEELKCADRNDRPGVCQLPNTMASLACKSHCLDNSATCNNVD